MDEFLRRDYFINQDEEESGKETDEIEETKDDGDIDEENIDDNEFYSSDDSELSEPEEL